MVVFWTQLRYANLKFIYFALCLLAAILCVIDCYLVLSIEVYILGIDFVVMEFFHK